MQTSQLVQLYTLYKYMIGRERGERGGGTAVHVGGKTGVGLKICLRQKRSCVFQVHLRDRLAKELVLWFLQKVQVPQNLFKSLGS